jgi:ketosteroid isomerase-like protein
MRVGRNTGGETTLVEQLNGQRVRNFLDAFYSRDIEGALACCTDDVDFVANVPIDIMPHMGHRHGKAGMREMWSTIYTRYSGMRYEMTTIVTEGDQVAAKVRAFLHKRDNDRTIQIDIAAFYTFRGGRIAQIREVMDTFDLVQQVLERDVAAVLAENKPDRI